MAMKKLSLQEVLEGIEDTRRERSVWYPLYEVLFIMLTAVICGATSYAKVEMFGKSREQWLKKYIKLENGIPDACTFRNVIKAIDTRQLHTVFVEWMRNAVENVTGIVAIDGKQARRTKDARKPPLHVVSAFSAECSLVLGQLACGEKSNEITAIPKLLDMLELKGCIVTIDAMGTQTEIAKKIREKGADYILSLKENQKTLYEDARLFFEEYRKAPAGLDADCCATSHSQRHGRYESRTCYICEDIWMVGRPRKMERSGWNRRHFLQSRTGGKSFKAGALFHLQPQRDDCKSDFGCKAQPLGNRKPTALDTGYAVSGGREPGQGGQFRRKSQRPAPLGL